MACAPVPLMVTVEPAEVNVPPLFDQSPPPLMLALVPPLTGLSVPPLKVTAPETVTTGTAVPVVKSNSPPNTVKAPKLTAGLCVLANLTDCPPLPELATVKVPATLVSAPANPMEADWVVVSQ